MRVREASKPEALHDAVALLLGHVSMHGRYREVVLLHLLCEPIHLSLGIAEDDSLCDGQGVVQITEGVKLPLLLLYCHKKLLDALQHAPSMSATASCASSSDPSVASVSCVSSSKPATAQSRLAQ